ncbi:SorA family sulfite dehydrogenase catalytic subunit [Glaciimonas soli]|uniref:Molybdopterin-dependent oxidoreductase n=1 Tax=Glaciimonas soli TaxID=2590999 RepID=A0A843YJD6_9BURK|nr:molybdopterin-dependent oxidoreductase [Glaciimonas soli]MQQ99888.1 molybdopterin-dependent oxidoreductase [Glaciimonas soli]
MRPNENRSIEHRRAFMQKTGLAALLLTSAPLRSIAANTVTTATETMPFGNGERDLIAYPQKRPLMRITTRPPHLETPFSVFNEGPITANDAFFVRYHLAGIPTSIDAKTYRLKVGGLVERSLSLSLAELKAIAPPVEVVAVNQCSGNSRGFSEPRVFGAQLGNGSMGNARWVGVPLKAVLAHAGIKAGAKQVSFQGLDRPVLPSTPDFIKAIDIDLAQNGDAIIAWSMNGKDIPFLNGYPIKLIVPGYFGTYWVKHLNDIEVLDHVFDGFFMSTAYRVPDNDCQCVPAGSPAGKTRPIGKLKVRSFITSLHDGATIQAGKFIEVKGIAFDSGAGIKTIDVSDDDGQTWKSAMLAKDLGRYSFREWRLGLTPSSKGTMRLLVRATTQSGEVQPLEASWNPSGYARNVVEAINLTVV